MDFLKNPIVIGALAGLITYGYFYYDAQKNKEDNNIKKSVPILTPLIVAVIVWFVTSCYFDRCCETVKLNVLTPNQRTVHTLSNNSDINTRSYHLIGKNKIRLPSTDVFIDIANFD